MAQAVSNDALWEKLSEVDKKLEKLVITQESLIPEENMPEIKIDFGTTKEGIIAEIKEQAHKLGKHADSHFGANTQNMQMLDENIQKILNTIAHIRKQQRETTGAHKTNNTYLSFLFFKIRKSSLIIAILGLLIFVLTLFCMKQQNDYALLLDEFYRQNIVIKEIQTEVDSLRAAVQKPEPVKKRR